MAVSTLTNDPATDLAYTMLGEANPGDTAGMTAVGNTVLNRLAAGNYGSTISSVVGASNQYAAWGIGDDAAAQVSKLAPLDQRFPAGSSAYQSAYNLAQQLINGEVQDNTGGAVNYRAAGHVPSSWGDNTVNIGGNVYQSVHPVSAGTQLIGQAPDASTLDAYNGVYNWSSLPDANPTTGAPAAAASPSTALDAIATATGQSPSGAASAYSGTGVVQQGSQAAQPAPLAPLPATTPAQTAPSPPAASAGPVAPTPMLPSDVDPSPEAVSTAALASVKNWLVGSNVDLSKISPDQQAQLVRSFPTIAELASNPKAELAYLQSSGLGDALTSAVPSHTPNFAEQAWASMNGVTLPAKLPNDIGDWGLPTGKDPNAAMQAIGNFLNQAEMRVPNYGPDTGSDLGSVPSWQDAYTSNPAAVAAGSRSSSNAPASSGNSLASWAAPYYENVGGGSSAGSSSGSGNALNSWASPYYEATAPAGQDIQNGELDAMGSSYGVADAAIPRYITISKQVQVPADQPIETGDGVHWDAASGNYVLDAQTAPAATPKMVTKTIQQRVANPAYVAPAPQPVAPQPVAAPNGYNYLAKAGGSYTNVGQTNPNLTPAQVYSQAAAPAVNSQPAGNGNSAGVSTSGYNTQTGGQGGQNYSQSRNQSSGGSLTGSQW